MRSLDRFHLTLRHDRFVIAAIGHRDLEARADAGLAFDTVDRNASVNGRALALSTHELGVLEVLIQRFGRVVSKEQMVEQLYNYDKGVSHNAIEVYVHRLRKKIAGAGVTVKTVYGRGYTLDYMSH